MQCASAGGIPGGRGQSNQKRKDVLFMSDSVHAAEAQKLSLAPFVSMESPEQESVPSHCDFFLLSRFVSARTAGDHAVLCNCYSCKLWLPNGKTDYG